MSRQRANAIGFCAVLLCAPFWNGPSVLSRGPGDVPTASFAVFCAATAVLSAFAHLAFETTVWPDHATGWAATPALGLGAVGLALYVWDIGVKRGDIQLLGVASHAAPVLSTLVLVAAGIASASWPLLVSAGLIAGGAGLAAWTSARNS